MSALRHARACWDATFGGSLPRVRGGPRQAIALMYHEVLPDDVDIPSWMVVKQSAFEHQMCWLREHFNVVDLETVVDQFEGHSRAQPSDKPLAIVTFDDGYAGNLSCVLPIMRSLQLPFVVYVATRATRERRRFWYDEVASALMNPDKPIHRINTSRGTLTFRYGSDSQSRRWDRINSILTIVKRLPAQEREALAQAIEGKRAFSEYRMLTADEVATLSRDALVSIGNHTHTHDLLDQIDIEQARSSIVRAQEVLSDLTGMAPRHFSYPNGNHSGELEELVKSLGFRTAVATTFGVWRDKTSKYRIPRLSVGRFDSLWKFRLRALLAVTTTVS